MSRPSHAVTLMTPDPVVSPLAALKLLLAEQGVDVLDERALPVPRTLTERRGAHTVLVDGVREPNALRAALDGFAAEHAVDCVLQTSAVRQANYRLAVFDMDSTLIQCEVIDELAELAGVGSAVAAITERAMQGELDFKGSFTERLGMLRGLDASALATVAAQLPITEGMPELMATLRAQGIYTAILSGGFDYFARALQARYGFDEIHANHLGIESGAATGVVVGDIVDGARKKALLESIAAKLGIGPDQVIAVGDGANDLPMLGYAGLGIAFEAKPTVRAQVQHNIRHVGLDGVLYLLGAPSELAPAGR